MRTIGIKEWVRAMILEKTAAGSGKLEGVLRRELSLSGGLIKRLKWENAFFVNGKPAHTDYIVHPGDILRVEVREKTEGFPAENLPIDILYEDEFLIAADKSAGMLVHPSPRRNEGTLANALLGYYEKNGEPCGIHPVSRLDRDTFGVVLFAKNAHVHAKLCALLKSGGVEKTYHAAVLGCPEDVHGFWEYPVYKVGGGSLLRIVDARGQTALSEYTVLEKFGQTSLLQLHPHTGRTHQLRLHCLSAGCPILGDPQYCTEQSKAYSDACGLFTQQLCAVELAFAHPMTGEPLRIRSKQKVCFQTNTK